jgi:hypothetical protein
MPVQESADLGADLTILGAGAAEAPVGINVRRVMNRTAAPSFVVAGLCGALAIYSNLTQVTYLEMPKVAGYGLGLSVLECAYVLCAISAAVVVGGFVAAPAITRFGPRPTILQDATPAEAAMYSSANTVISAGISGLGAGIFTAVLTSAPAIPQPE